MKGLKFSVAGLAASVVSLYANHLSAKKGYRCLHASCSGGASCSTYAADVLRRDIGDRAKLALIKNRLAVCQQFNEGVGMSRFNFAKNMRVYGLLGAGLFALTGCGGGGGGGSETNSAASITGDTLGVIAMSAGTTASGRLSVTDADAGQSVFRAPTSLTGTYGYWTFDVNTGAWTYTADVGRTTTIQGEVQETLSVSSSDGSATSTITVRISRGGFVYPVTSVPAPIYSSSDAYANEKVDVFNRLNDDRHRCGFGKLSQNPKLDVAAQGHANYMITDSANDAGHYQQVGNTGFTGTTPGDRMTAAGYNYAIGYENNTANFFGTFFSEAIGGRPSMAVEPVSTVNLRGLLTAPYHLAGLMSPGFEVGIGVSKKVVNASVDSNAKFLVVLAGVPVNNALQEITSLKSFPCEGVTDASPSFTSELPDPFPDFPNASRRAAPYGQPVYLRGAPGTTTVMSSGVIQPVGGAAVPTRWLNSSNDPHLRLQPNEVFLVPTQQLAENTAYSVTLVGTNTGEVTPQNPTGAFTKTFVFSTGAL